MGSDRVREFDTIIKKYNNVKSRHGFYNFDKINIVSHAKETLDVEVSRMYVVINETQLKRDITSFQKGAYLECERRRPNERCKTIEMVT